MNHRAFGRIALAFWVLTFVACAPAFAQAKELPQLVTFDQLSGYLGVTFCTEKGAYSFVLSTLDGIARASTEAHEAKHREQVHRFRNCAAFQRWYATPVGKLDSEAEAFAADWCVAVSLGADALTLWQEYADRIQHYLGGEINRLTVLQTMQKYRRCQ